MRRWLFVVAVLALAMPTVGATGGSTTFRIFGPGGVAGFSMYEDCVDAGPEAEPACNSALKAASANCAKGGDPSDALNASCVLVRDTFGYNGVGGGAFDVRDHVNHAFECAVTSSATAVVGNALPFPANMALSDRIVVGFDTDGDGLADRTQGESVQRPAAWDVAWRVAQAAYNGDVNALAATPQWVLDQTSVDPIAGGPVVSGNVEGARVLLWAEGLGSDMTVECTF